MQCSIKLIVRAQPIFPLLLLFCIKSGLDNGIAIFCSIYVCVDALRKGVRLEFEPVAEARLLCIVYVR